MSSSQATETTPLLDTPGKTEVPSRPRDEFWDNYKAVCAFNVLVMHIGTSFWRLVPPESVLGTALGRMWVTNLGFVLLFAMPGFCFVTGFYSKSSLNKAQRVNLVRYVVTFFIQHGLCFFMALPGDLHWHRAAWEQRHPYVNETNDVLKAEGLPDLHPPGILPLHWCRFTGLDWYLFCVIVWRCLLPLLAQLKRPLLISVVVALAAMFTDVSYTTYGNATFGFLPFFLLGFYLKQMPSWIENIRGNTVVRVSFLMVATVWHLSAVIDTEFVLYSSVVTPLGCLYGGEVGAEIQAMANVPQFLNEPVPGQLPMSYCMTLHGVANVAKLYLMATLAILGLMSVVPTGEKPLMTQAGLHAIYIYFGQVWLIVLFGHAIAHVGAQPGIPVVAAMSLSFFAIFLSCVLLSHSLIKRGCACCIEPGVERGCLAIVAEEGAL